MPMTSLRHRARVTHPPSTAGLGRPSASRPSCPSRHRRPVLRRPRNGEERRRRPVTASCRTVTATSSPSITRFTETTGRLPRLTIPNSFSGPPRPTMPTEGCVQPRTLDPRSARRRTFLLRPFPFQPSEMPHRQREMAGPLTSKKHQMIESQPYKMPTKKSAELATPSGTRRSSPVADFARSPVSKPTKPVAVRTRRGRLPSNCGATLLVRNEAPATDAETLKAELKRWCGRKSAGAHT